MKKIRRLLSIVYCTFICFFMNITAFAEGAQEFTESDRRIFGIFPIWMFMLIVAAVVMLVIIIIIEVFKRKNK